MKDNKKKIILISIIIVLISLVIGISYAYWKFSKQQNTNNNISTLSCLNLEIVDVSDAISLTDASPITDEDAEGLKPYEFKVINTCENFVNYSINLEVMEIENRLNSNYVAVKLDNKEKEILGSKIQVPINYNGKDYTSVEAYDLGSEYISGGEEKTHSLRIWIDENAADKNDAMSKKFISKIVVSGNVINDPTIQMTLNGNIITDVPVKSNYKITIDCGDTAVGEWDYSNWNLKLTKINSSNIICNINFININVLAAVAKLGDYVEMTPTSTSYSIKNGIFKAKTINPSNLSLWRVIKINDDGTIEMVSQNISNEGITINGKNGYLGLVGGLNEIARQYENNKYTISSRYMGYNNQTEYITDDSKMTADSFLSTSTDGNDGHKNQYEEIGGGDQLYINDYNLVKNAIGKLGAISINSTDTRNYYWLASREYFISSKQARYWSPRFINNNGVLDSDNYSKNVYECGTGSVGDYDCGSRSVQNRGIRPIIVLKSGLKVNGSETSEDHYKFVD